MRLVLLDQFLHLEMVSAMMKQIMLTVITMDGTVAALVLSQISVQSVLALVKLLRMEL